MRRIWRFFLECYIRYTYITYRSKRVRSQRFIPPCWTWAELSSAFFLPWWFPQSSDAARLALHGLARLCPRRTEAFALVAITKLRVVHFPYFPRSVSTLT